MLEHELYAHVEYLCSIVGERNFRRYREMLQAEEWLQGWLPEVERYRVGGQEFANLFLVGAHYDSLVGTVGANDNGTGVAALLALAGR